MFKFIIVISLLFFFPSLSSAQEQEETGFAQGEMDQRTETRGISPEPLFKNPNEPGEPFQGPEINPDPIFRPERSPGEPFQGPEINPEPIPHPGGEPGQEVGDIPVPIPHPEGAPVED